jgi:hypothetical protein
VHFEIHFLKEGSGIPIPPTIMSCTHHTHINSFVMDILVYNLMEKMSKRKTFGMLFLNVRRNVILEKNDFWH